MSFNDTTMPLGNAGSFTDTITQSDGVTPYNLTGATINFVAALAAISPQQALGNPPSGLVVFNKVSAAGSSVPPIQSPTPTNGVVVVWFTPSDTQSYPAWTLLFCYVIVTDASGNIYTVKKFTVRLSV